MNLAFIPAGIGATELIIVLVVVLLIFGPKRLPSLARSVGGGMREFKDSIAGKSDDDDAKDETVRASAALGRPDEPVAARVAEEEAVPERR